MGGRGGGGGGGIRGGDGDDDDHSTIKAFADLCSESLLEAPWSHLGDLLWQLWELPEHSWGHLGALLGASEALLGPSWRPSSKKVAARISTAPQSPKSRFLGASWGALGRSWGRLGTSWTPLGAILSHIGAILRPQKPTGSGKARSQTSMVFIWFWKDLGLLGASL